MAEKVPEAPVLAIDGDQDGSQEPNKHPLLIEDVLDNLFPYFNDSTDLGSFRLVHNAWDTSASRTVKKNLRWKIGPESHCEKRFMEVMSNCGKDLLGNFNWTDEKQPKIHQDKEALVSLEKSSPESVQPFLESYGSRIVNLRLRAFDPEFIQHRLRSSYLPNLEHLELYDISTAVMKEETFGQIQCFPKLKSICFTPEDFQRLELWDKLLSQLTEFRESQGLIFDKILEAAPKLAKMEVNIPKMVKKILKNPDALVLDRMANITVFKIRSAPVPEGFPSFPTPMALDGIELKNLLECCPHLKVLCVPVSVLVKQREICEMLAESKICAQLEELSLVICFSVVLEDTVEEGAPPPAKRYFFVVNNPRKPSTTSSDDETDLEQSPATKRRKSTQKPAQCSLPAMPRLTKLRLHYWLLHDFDIFYSATKLMHVDLILNDTPFITSENISVFGENLSVRQLKLRGSSRIGINQHGIQKFSSLLPNLEELDVKLYKDEDLEAIFKYMPKLKRLNLNDSPITDEGLTGMSVEKLKEASEKSFKLEQIVGTEWRQKFYVGNLTDLQQFSYAGYTASNWSIKYGIAALKNLTNFKFNPRYISWFSAGDPEQCTGKVNEPVDIHPLLTNCAYLIKMDVNRTFADLEDAIDADMEVDKPIKSEFKGCGLISDDVALVKQTFPNLDLVYGEKDPPRTPA